MRKSMLLSLLVIVCVCALYVEAGAAQPPRTNCGRISLAGRNPDPHGAWH